MPYSTPAMVRLALVPDSDGGQPDSASPTHTAADLSDGTLIDAIAEADSTIDSYLNARYAIPVAVIEAGNPHGYDGVAGAIPHPVDFLSRTIAAYLATITFKKSQDFADTDPIVRRYKAAMDLLNQIAAGKVNLNLPENTGDSSAIAVGQAYNPYVGTLWDVTDFDLSPAWSPALDAGWRGWARGW